MRRHFKNWTNAVEARWVAAGQSVARGDVSVSRKWRVASISICLLGAEKPKSAALARAAGLRAGLAGSEQLKVEDGFRHLTCADIKRAARSAAGNDRTPQTPSHRRASETFSFRCNDLEYTASVAFFPDGDLTEVFLSNVKAGSQSDGAAKDKRSRVFDCPSAWRPARGHQARAPTRSARNGEFAAGCSSRRRRDGAGRQRKTRSLSHVLALSPAADGQRKPRQERDDAGERPKVGAAAPRFYDDPIPF